MRGKKHGNKDSGSRIVLKGGTPIPTF